MALDPATVRRIATLARIRMDDAEVDTIMGELNGDPRLDRATE